MGVGKYSPTISHSYSLDQEWWTRNGGGYGNGKNPDADADDDGFDSYGYSGPYGDGPDRAGYTESQYAEGYHDDYELYEEVSGTWGGRLLGDLADYLPLKEVEKHYGVEKLWRFPEILGSAIHAKAIRHCGLDGLRGIHCIRIHKDDVEALRPYLAKYGLCKLEG